MPSMPMPPLRSFYFPLAGGLLAGAAKAEQFRSSAAGVKVEPPLR